MDLCKVCSNYTPGAKDAHQMDLSGGEWDLYFESSDKDSGERSRVHGPSYFHLGGGGWGCDLQCDLIYTDGQKKRYS